MVGSSDEVKIGNKMVKARQYPWGTVQGNNMIIDQLKMSDPRQCSVTLEYLEIFSAYHRFGFHV